MSAPSRCQKPVETYLWAGGWCLVGNGPSYLLFTPSKEVIHLTSGLDRALRRHLQGYRAIGSQSKLEPLVEALEQASSIVIYDLDWSADAPKRKLGAYKVVCEIEELIDEFRRDRENFERRLRRLATLIRAAGILRMYHRTPPEAPTGPAQKSPPESSFARNQYGQRLLIMHNPYFVFRLKPDSQIAGCAQELWRREQAHWRNRAAVLYRVPIRKELRAHLCLDEPAVTKLCRAEGFDWLPRTLRAPHP
jgi:hypothetical protein